MNLADVYRIMKRGKSQGMGVDPETLTPVPSSQSDITILARAVFELAQRVERLEETITKGEQK